MQTRAFYSRMLKTIDLCGISQKQHRSELPCSNPVLGGFTRTEHKDLTQLADLLFRRHLPQETVCALLNSGFRLGSNVGPSRGILSID